MKICRTFFAVLITALLFGPTGQARAAVQITGSLANYDVRYPSSLPNDHEIYLYGDGLTPACVIGTWNTNTLLGSPPAGMQWGPANSITASVNNDPTSPAFGLDCIMIRWVGPPRPALVGRLVHFGVHLRPGCAVAHQEVWWTINGQRVQRPGDPQITWNSTPTGWLISVANPNPVPIYIYGCRQFAPAAPPTPLPNLNQLNFGMNPAQFGGTWANLALPGGGPVLALPAWGRIHFRVVAAAGRPVVLQLGVRDVSHQASPLQPAGDGGPNPNDFNGEMGTMMIMTTRPTQEFREDINGDGVVGVPDFNMLRARFGTVSQDLNP